MRDIAVVTVAHRRLAHLTNVQRGLSSCADAVKARVNWVVVAVDDPETEQWRPTSGLTPTIVPMDAAGRRLPIAAARNRGAEAALAIAPELLVFLDVDCIPDPAMLHAYLQASRRRPRALLCGAVAYLPPPPPDGYDLTRLRDLATPHPARPAPPPGVLVGRGDPDLFWSLSFAVTPRTWRQVGGFCEEYAGYGGEDTDLARQAERLDVELVWVGGAEAHHQFHPVSDPPVEHLDDILRNGALFARRWGAWPMTGWLRAFESKGLIRRTRDGWTRTDSP